MARIKSTNFYQKSGKVANEVFSNLGNGEVGRRAKNSKQAPLNEEQKINASGFSALNAEVRYLNPVLHVTFPRDTNGVKWANRFTSVNKKREGVLTTTKIHPDSPVDPKKKANEEYTSEIDWTKVLFAAGPLLIPSVTVSKANLSREQIIADKINRLENIHIKGKFDYNAIQSLSTEARQKLTRIDPDTIAQASRIPGISPSDINILLVMLGR